MSEQRRIPRVNDPGRVGRGRVKFPLRENTDGTVDLVRSGIGAIGLDPVRGIKVEVHSPLTIVSGSPHSVTLELAPGLEDRGGILGPSLSSSVQVQGGSLVATPDASQVTVDDGMTGVGGSTVEDQIARLQLNKASTIDLAALDARVVALEALVGIPVPWTKSQVNAATDATYAAATNEFITVKNAGSGACEITLPDTGDGANTGFSIGVTVLNVSGVGALTVVADGGGTVGLVASFTVALVAGTTYIFICDTDNSNWVAK